MRALLLSLSIAIIFSSSCNGLDLSNIFNLQTKLPDLLYGLSNAQTVGNATKTLLDFLKNNFDPSLDVNSIYQNLTQQYGSQLDSVYSFNLTPARLTQFFTTLVSLLQNRPNNSNIYSDLLNLIMQTGMINPSMPTGQPTGPTPTMNPNLNGFLVDAFGMFAKNFFTNLLTSLQPGQLDAIIADSTIKILTPEVISAIKSAIQVVNPTLYNTIKDINDPQTFYFLAQTYIKPYVTGFLSQIGSYFGIDFNGILNPNGTQSPPVVTTIAPTDPYLDSLYKMLTELDAGKANLQYGTQLTKAIFLGSIFMKYPNVSAVLQQRLKVNRPDVYQQISSNNDSLASLIQFVPYLPELLNNDLQRIKSVYGIDYSYLLSSTYILSINSAVPTNPPGSTPAGSTLPPLTQSTTRPASTLPPVTLPPSTQPPLTQTTTRPASTLPPTTTRATTGATFDFSALFTTTTATNTTTRITSPKSRPVFG